MNGDRITKAVSYIVGICLHMLVIDIHPYLLLALLLCRLLLLIVFIVVFLCTVCCQEIALRLPSRGGHKTVKTSIREHDALRLEQVGVFLSGLYTPT